MDRFGHSGKILRVDLSRGALRDEEIPEELYRRYLGGGALGLYFLLKDVPRHADPLGPENILAFLGSAVTGTPALGFSRFSVVAKSPLTGGFGESEAGGWWGPELKAAGYDGIIFSGKAGKPVYLWLQDGKAELRSAEHLWGTTSGDAQAAIRQELGDSKIKVAVIGPGGEKQIPFACILNELKHANGRSGMGAVMGSKNLKAVAVRGTSRPVPAHKEKVTAILRDLAQSWKNNPTTMTELGTARGVRGLQGAGILPTRNFTEGTFSGFENISAEYMRDSILTDRGTCYGCYVKCKREVRVDEGEYHADPEYGGPEYETIAAFGSGCGIDNLQAIATAHQICQEYTVDTISAGVRMAYAIECFEKELLTEADTDGIRLAFGEAGAMLAMLRNMVKREGFGVVLSGNLEDLIAFVGERSRQYAMHVKGMMVPLHDPRGKTGVGLAYAVSASGPDHMEVQHDPVLETEAGLELYKPIGLIEGAESHELGVKKVRQFAYLQTLYSMYNSLGFCAFCARPVGPFTIDRLVEYVRAVTGWNTSLWDLMKVGERHSTLARIFNLREGKTESDDTLPERLFTKLGGDGPESGSFISRDDFKQAVISYYLMMGWNSHGVPELHKLQELDIEWSAEQIPAEAKRAG